MACKQGQSQRNRVGRKTPATTTNNASNNSHLKSQVLRFKSVSSHKRVYEKACNILFSALRKRWNNKSKLGKTKRDIWLQTNTIEDVRVSSVWSFVESHCGFMCRYPNFLVILLRDWSVLLLSRKVACLVSWAVCSSSEITRARTWTKRWNTRTNRDTRTITHRIN